MSELHKIPDHIRQPETYTTFDLCDYSRDILLYTGEENEGEDHASTAWETELAAINLIGKKLENGEPYIRMHVKDHRWLDHERTYLMRPSTPAIGVFNGDGQPIPSDNLYTLSRLLMQYLRTNPDVNEPKLDTSGAIQFQRLAARTAIGSAIATAKIDALKLAEAHGDNRTTLRKAAIRQVLEQGITANDTFYPYTTSRSYITDELRKFTQGGYVE